MSAIDPRAFSQRLLDWYDVSKRDLPWRKDKNPYRIWVSEIMLQQTRVETVIPYYERFLTAFPTIERLACAKDDHLAKQWEGLGYYRRVKHMKEAANQIMDRHGGVFPTRKEDVEALKGIGEYTSGAIRSIAFDQKAAAVDGNVLRVAARLLGETGDIAETAVKRRLGNAVEQWLPEDRNGDFTQALMELGATVCLPNGTPRCDVCPFRDECVAKQSGRVDRIPKKAKKPSRRVEAKTVFLLYTREGLIHLTKRPEDGLLAGLWEFDGEDGVLDEATARSVLSARGYRVRSMSFLGFRTHVFSHVEWKMTGFAVLVEPEDSDSNGIWMSQDDIDSKYSIPSAFRPYFEQFIEKQVRF